MRLKRIEWILLGAGAALVILLAVSYRRIPGPSRRAAPSGLPVAAPGNAGRPTSLLSGFDYTESTAGRPRFRIRAERTVGFSQGAGLPSTWYGLAQVSLTLYSADRPPVTVSAEKADYDPRTNAAHLAGNVILTESSGTSVHTGRLHFDPSKKQITLPETITFLRGGLTGQATSATYDLEKGEIQFAGPVTARGVTGSGKPSSLAAERATYLRTPPQLAFFGNVKAASGSNTVSADTVTVHFTDQDRLQAAEAEGDVTGTLEAGGTGASGTSVDQYSGTDLKLTFDADGQVRDATLTGAPARLREPGAASNPRRSVSARTIACVLAAGKLESARASGGAQLESATAEGSGEPGLQVVTSDVAEASYDAEGALEKAIFTGHVKGSSPRGRASAPAAVYQPSKDLTILTGDDREDAELVSDRGRIVGRRIEIEEKKSQVTATGNARGFFRGGKDTSVPSFLSSSSEPTRARARRLLLDDAQRTVLLTGAAALWQGTNALFADEIFLNDADRSATGLGSVRVVASEAQKKDKVTATSARMRYEDIPQTAVFEENVRVRRGTAFASGDRGEAHFDDSHHVDRTSLEGVVQFEDPATGRRGQGTCVVDEPPHGVTTLTGNPAVAYDGKGDRVTGAILTFRKESGSVEAQSKEGEKIETIYQTHGI
jgi:LPS export ABC transporter protein LptC